jgi:hypothetical protein
MTLRETLTFKSATLPSLKIKAHGSILKAVLDLKAELTAETAKIIGCYDSAFDGQDNPRGGFEKIELQYEIEACQIKLKSEREAGMSLLITPRTINKFKVLRISDASLGLAFSVETDRAMDAIAFMIDTLEMTFEVVVEPSQTDLDFSGENTLADKPVGDSNFLKELGVSEEDEEDDDPEAA